MKKILVIIVMSIMLFSTAFLVLAATSESGGISGGGTAGNSKCTPGKICNPIKYNTFSDFVAAITKAAVQVLMPFVVLAFIYSGFLFVSAQGNDEKLTHAKAVLWYSMIGAFVLFGAWGFAQIISKTISAITS